MSILSQQKQSQNTDFPNLRPSLDLRFALAKKLDPRITFTRGSTGTYFGPDGLMRTAGVNQPRFDHDPITGQSLGLLIEESRTNSLLRSEDFTTTWTISNSSIQSNVITAPDGNTTADKLVENSSTGNKEVTQGSITFTSGTSLTFSCFIKAGERNLFRFAATTGFFASETNAYFNLTSGTVSLIQGGITSASIIPYPNGWYRCVATMLPTSSGTGNVYITLVRSGTTSNYGGDGTSGIYVWGAQVEAGAFPTSYIPTSASTVTRSADLASMTGTNFSSWYNQNEGTIMVDCASPTLSTIPVAISDGTTNNRFQLEVGTNTRGVRVVFNGITQTSYVSYTYNRKQKMIMSYSSNSVNFANAGYVATLIRPQGIPNVNILRIGANVSNAGQNNLPISRLTYYPIALTSTQLANLTS